MVVAVDVEDVAAHLLEQRPLLARSNISAIFSPGKVALFVRRKNVAGVAVEHEVAELRRREPGLGAQRVHRLVEALAA